MTIQSMLRKTIPWGLAAIVWAGTSAIPDAQVASSPAPDTVVVMGCVSQQPAAQAERGSQPALVITDTRSKPPRKFVLRGNAGQLAWHVGHTIEVHGRLVTSESKDAAAPNAQLPVLEVRSVIYLQPTCASPK